MLNKLIQFIKEKLYIINSFISLFATYNTIVQQHDIDSIHHITLKIDLQ